MTDAFSSAKGSRSRRWAAVVPGALAAFSLVTVPACTNMTNDAEPVLHKVAIPGLAARAAAGTEAYVCNFGYDSAPGATVTAVDLEDANVDARITTGTLPDAIAASPDGRMLLVADEGQDLLRVLDTSDGDVIATVGTGVEPDAVAVAPDGALAVVANSDDGTVTPVDLRTMRALEPIHVGAQPDAVAIGGPGGRTALVGDLGAGTVVPIDLQTLTAGAPIAVGSEPVSIALSPDGDIAAVANLGSNSVTFVNMVSLRALRTVPVGVAPTAIASEPSSPSGGGVASAVGELAWVTGGTSLVPVSFESEAVASPVIDVGRLVEDVAISPGGDSAWVADHGPDITEVDLASGRPVKSVTVGGRPSEIVIPPARH